MSTVRAASVRAVVITWSIGTDSSGPWASLASPGPYCTDGMPPSPVSSRRSLPYGAPYTSSDVPPTSVVRRSHAFDEIAVGRELTGFELATPPLDVDGMIAQPRIAGARFGDGVFQLATGLVDRLAEGDTEPAFGDQQVGHGRRPITGGHGADRERMRQRPSRHQRVDDLVPALFEIAQCLPHRPERFDRVDALGSSCGVRRPAVNSQAERECSRVGRDDVEIGGLRDDAGVGTPAALQRRERSESSVLLALHRGHEHVAAETDAAAAYRLHGDVGRDQPGLHVAGTAAEHPPIPNLAAERR